MLILRAKPDPPTEHAAERSRRSLASMHISSILMADPTLSWLQDWYLNQCDDAWEHSYGVTINTLDNPGWSLKITIQDTPLENRDFEDVAIERSENDWLRCWLGKGQLDEKAFEAACGPKNLIEVLELFRDWANNNR